MFCRVCIPSGSLPACSPHAGIGSPACASYHAGATLNGFMAENAVQHLCHDCPVPCFSASCSATPRHFALEMPCGVKQGETPPRCPLLRCRRNSLAASGSGFRRETCEPEHGPGPQDIFKGKTLCDESGFLRHIPLKSEPPNIDMTPIPCQKICWPLRNASSRSLPGNTAGPFFMRGAP